MLTDLFFIGCIVMILILIYRNKFSKQKIQAEVEEAIQHVDNRELLIEEGSEQDSESETGKEEFIDRRKQMRKEQKQKEKQERKQGHQAWLKEQQKKRDEYYKEQEEKDRLEEEKKRKEDEIIAQLRENERKRKEEEFNEWKSMFAVEQTGNEKLSEEEEQRKCQERKQNLLNTLKTNKLSLLEDLSHEFKLTVAQIVKQIKLFEQEGTVTGVFDQRGKYLSIQPQEWTAIRNYIQAKGRVRKVDIMRECARIIKIPNHIDKGLLDLVQLEGENK